MSRRSQKNLKVILVGAKGRMGREIARLILRDKKMQIVARVDQASDWTKIKYSKNVDGVIDFSGLEGFREALAWCVSHRVAFLSGTTGLKPADFKNLKKAAKKVPVLYSANMSPGVIVMRTLMAALGGLKGWKFRLEETHHTKKKDKPSGTAKMLASHLNAAIAPAKVKIVSYRRGQVPGIHIVEALGPDETLSIGHTAHHRRIFARGAVVAARWLFQKSRPGFYDVTEIYS